MAKKNTDERPAKRPRTQASVADAPGPPAGTDIPSSPAVSVAPSKARRLKVVPSTRTTARAFSSDESDQEEEQEQQPQQQQQRWEPQTSSAPPAPQPATVRQEPHYDAGTDRPLRTLANWDILLDNIFSDSEEDERILGKSIRTPGKSKEQPPSRATQTFRDLKGKETSSQTPSDSVGKYQDYASSSDDEEPVTRTTNSCFDDIYD